MKKNLTEQQYKAIYKQKLTLLTKFKYSLLTFFAYVALYFLKLIGVQASKKFCISILSLFGPKINLSKYMKKNIAMCFPKLSEQEVADINKGAWKNFAEVIGLYPFIDKIDTLNENKFEVIGWHENVQPLLNANKGIIFASAHIGNWELICNVAQDRNCIPYRIFKAPKNPYVLNLFFSRVKEEYKKYLLPASNRSVITCIKQLTAGQSLALLVDQRRAGPLIDFFGQQAPTSNLIASIANKTNAPIVPCRLLHSKNNKYKVIIEKPMYYNDFKNDKKLLQAINNRVQQWVKETPEQWFWQHMRWQRQKEMQL